MMLRSLGRQVLTPLVNQPSRTFLTTGRTAFITGVARKCSFSGLQSVIQQYAEQQCMIQKRQFSSQHEQTFQPSDVKSRTFNSLPSEREQSLLQDPNYDPTDPHFTEERLVMAMYAVPSITGFLFLFYLWNPYRGTIDPPNFGIVTIMLAGMGAFGIYGASVFGAMSRLSVAYYFFFGLMVLCAFTESRVHANVYVHKG